MKKRGQQLLTMSEEKYTIEIDCAPLTPRPDTWFKLICQEIGMSEDEFQLTNKFFGEWTWKVKPESIERYKVQQQKVGEILKDLNKKGNIRYGSW